MHYGTKLVLYLFCSQMVVNVFLYIFGSEMVVPYFRVMVIIIQICDLDLISDLWICATCNTHQMVLNIDICVLDLITAF